MFHLIEDDADAHGLAGMAELLRPDGVLVLSENLIQNVIGESDRLALCQTVQITVLRSANGRHRAFSEDR